MLAPIFILLATSKAFLCSPLPSLCSTRLVFLVSGGPGRPPLPGRSVALGLRNKLHKQKNDFLIYKAWRVDTVGECRPSHGNEFLRCMKNRKWRFELFCRGVIFKSNCRTLANYLVSDLFDLWLTSSPPVCQLNCSSHGECDTYTRRCVCQPFWMENFIRSQLGDAESNCGENLK